MYLDADYSLGGHPQAANDKARDLWLTGAKNLLPHLDSLVEKRMISMHKAVVLQLSKNGKRATGWIDRAPSHAATSNSLLIN